MSLLQPTNLQMGGFLSAEYHHFQYPSVGSLQYMRQWTFELGSASLEARAVRYGLDSEMPPLSPKSRLVHIALEEPLASPTTVFNRAPIYEDDEPPSPGNVTSPFEYNDKPLNCSVKQSRRSRRSSLSQCYSCGSACLDAHSRPPADESSHWFIDVHDGVTRKVAYVFCWKCVGVFMKQLQRAPHPGCGHLPLLSLPSCEEECQLMFCGRCRVDMTRDVGSWHGYV